MRPGPTPVGDRDRFRLGTIGVVLCLALAGCGTTDQAAIARRTPGSTTNASSGSGCDWPMWGHDLGRTFSTRCTTQLAPTTVPNLRQRWFFNTYDVVTATPAVVDRSVFVGDWSGRFYALDADTGAQRWVVQTDTHPNVYAGQIVSSAAIETVGGVRTVFFGAGQTMYALRADDGSVRWKRAMGPGDAGDFTEIESSPAVVDGKVVFGTDVHNHPGQRAGVHALDATTGEPVWSFDPDEGKTPSGCVDVWGSPSVDLERQEIYVGTGSCEQGLEHWTPYTEAIVALDLASGRSRWRFQPHEPNTSDLDFAGAPNLFEANGRPLIGLGNKDGSYYALDRENGRLVWKTTASGPSATGGFIGPTAYWPASSPGAPNGIIAGGTAFGPGPFLHGLSASEGNLLWQQRAAQPSYAASAVANGVLFVGSSDFTFRAVDINTGAVLWSQPVGGVVAGGAAIAGDDVFVVAGIREPGLDKRSETSGVYRFSLAAGDDAERGTSTTAKPTATTAAPSVSDLRLTNPAGSQRCIGTPCPFPFTLKRPPAGLAPSGTMTIGTDPFNVEVQLSGLGEPQQWIADGPAADEGATAFGLFASESDDNPVGGLLCIVASDGRCTATALPRLATYNRITLLALKDANAPPRNAAEGVPRLITTLSFEPPLTPEKRG